MHNKLNKLSHLLILIMAGTSTYHKLNQKYQCQPMELGWLHSTYIPTSCRLKVVKQPTACWFSTFGALTVQYTQCQSSSDLYALQKYSTKWIWCVISAWKVGMNWGVYKHIIGPVFPAALEKHVMELGIEKLKLGTAKWGFLQCYGNM